jgi:MoxR-like ATPase
MTATWPHPKIPSRVELPPLGHLPASTHIFDSKDVWAIRAAMGARRPLLVRGEPGTGKSQLARAAAQALGCVLVSEVVTSRTESQDLHWRFDAVARLGRAQALAAAGHGNGHSLEEHLYLSPGPLWWVFDWEGAESQRNQAMVKGKRPPIPERWTPKNGCVLLVDEIDKADADVPNGLLESLGNGEFHVPYLDQPVKCRTDQPAPLVVITTNEERELPPAFVRRCLVLQLSLPTGDALVDFLVERGRAHFPAVLTDRTLRDAAALVARDHGVLVGQGQVAPGQAEYLDLLRAVKEIAGADADAQASALDDVKSFVLEKNPVSPR